MMKKNNKHKMGRRKFLGTASCAALGYTTLFNTLVNLKTINAAAANNSFVRFNNDYKAMVCILLAGGNDSFNMLLPKGSPEYDEYATTRSNLAIAQNLRSPPKDVDQEKTLCHPRRHTQSLATLEIK